MSDLWIEIFNHFMEADNDAIKMQNRVNLELERMLIPYKKELMEEEKEKILLAAKLSRQLLEGQEVALP